MSSLNTGLNSDSLADLNDVVDLDSLLESLGLNLLTDNIVMQIRHETTSTTDFLSVAKDKFLNIIAEDSIDEEDKSEIKSKLIEFAEPLIQMIAGEYSLCINVISDDYESIYSTLETLYNFFVLNRYQNVEKFLIQYIDQYKDALVDTIDHDDKAKDITSLSNKKKSLNKSTIFVLSHISEIIDFICSGNIVDEKEFISIVNDGEYYTNELYNLIQDDVILGNFVPRFLNSVVGNGYDDDETVRIRNNIRVYYYTQENNTIEGEE